MKATLEFDLPEDESQLELARRAPDLLAVVRALDEYLRWGVKASGSSAGTMQSVRNRLHEILDESGVAHLLP